MKSSHYYDWCNRESVVTCAVSDLEAVRALRPEEIIVRVRDEIAARVADRVMALLNPAIDEALTRIAKGLDNSEHGDAG